MSSQGISNASPPLPAKKKAAGFSAKSLKSVVKQKVLPTVQAISGMGELSRRMKELRSVIGTKDEEIRQLKRKVLVLSDINGLSVKDVAAALERAARKRTDPEEHAKRLRRLETELAEAKKSSSKQLKLEIDKLRENLASEELKRLELTEQMQSKDNLAKDLLAKLSASERMQHRLCTQFIKTYREDHDDIEDELEKMTPDQLL